MKNKKGFTLVELVIVIAVIAILAAVLLPTFSNVIESAKQSSATQSATNAFKTYYATDSSAKYTDPYDTMKDYKGFQLVVDNGNLDSSYIFTIQEDGKVGDITKGVNGIIYGSLAGQTDIPSLYFDNGGKTGRLTNFGYNKVYILAPAS